MLLLHNASPLSYCGVHHWYEKQRKRKEENKREFPSTNHPDVIVLTCLNASVTALGRLQTQRNMFEKLPIFMDILLGFPSEYAVLGTGLRACMCKASTLWLNYIPTLKLCGLGRPWTCYSPALASATKTTFPSDSGHRVHQERKDLTSFRQWSWDWEGARPLGLGGDLPSSVFIIWKKALAITSFLSAARVLSCLPLL